MIRKLELLAPAKNFETGKAAINAGADAVYIGAGKFGARSSAGNSIADISKLINYAHFFNAKVYTTVNTLLYNNELAEAETLINDLYNAGIDAVIIQDMGILEMNLPPVPVFASTQTDNRTVEKILFLEKCGFNRVILARELSLAQIAEIKANTNIDLEFFVHGALCVSYSGQCYISQAVCKRSANRGECAQMCRSDYNLMDNNGKKIVANKHLLSLKDLNLTQSIPDLIEAGITSFKIEGRLKDIPYVKNVTAWYRNIIDSYLEKGKDYKKASSGKLFYTFAPNPEKSFNRQSIDYFIHNRTEKMVSLNTPKWLGEFIGTVLNVDEKSFVIETDKVISNGDGLTFFDSENRLTGVLANRVSGNIIFCNSTKDIRKNTLIYRNSDISFEKILLRDDSAKRKIKVNFVFKDFENGFELMATDEDDLKAGAKIYTKKELAENELFATEQIKKQLLKTGDTDFFAENIDLQLSGAFFIQASQINQLRREVLEMLSNQRKNNYKREVAERIVNSYPYPHKIIKYNGNVINELAVQFYKRHGVEHIEPGFEMSGKTGDVALMTTKYCILYELGECLKNKNNRITKQFKFPLKLENNKQFFKLRFDCANCEMIVYI